MDRINNRIAHVYGYAVCLTAIIVMFFAIKQIIDWEVPHNVKKVQSFLGFANFYRRFIKSYSKICTSLTDLTRKGVS